MDRLKDKIGLTLTTTIYIVIINIITIIIAAVLTYFFIAIDILDKKNIQNPIIILGINLIACIIIGILVSTISSKIVLKHVRVFIEAIAKLSRGDFSIRLNIKKPLEFKLLSENFNVMAKELEGIEVLRTDFINNFSHEFKTPIISIKGFAEILKDDNLSKEEKDEYLDIIIEESKRLATLSTNVLNLSKVENQVILNDINEFNVSEQIRQSILLLDTKFENKNISLDISIEDAYICGNKEMLNQVWLNLLDNSIKFNRINGIVSVTVRKLDKSIIVVITDSGIGVSRSSITRIFDKFYQEDTSHSRNGNGLGLTIVKKIIDLHGGTINCNSIQGKGTKFTIILPIKL